MKFFILSTIASTLLSSGAWALSTFPEITCYGIPISIPHAGGSSAQVKLDVTAGPISKGSAGLVSIETEDGNSDQKIEATQNATIERLETNDGTVYQYTSQGTRLVTDPKKCDENKHLCTVTFSISDGLSQGNSPDHYESGTAECFLNYTLTLAEAIETTLANYPDVVAARKAVLAARATEGHLWERFVPLLSTTASSTLTRSAVNIPGYALPNTVDLVSSQASLALSPNNYFAWNAAAIAANASKAQETIVENQLALKVISAYTAVYIGRQDVRSLQDVFLKTLRKLQSDPKVSANSQLSNLVNTLISTTQSTLIAQKFALVQAENLFRILTGITLDNEVPSFQNIGSMPDPANPLVAVSSLFADTIPLFPSAKAVDALAVTHSPLLKNAYFGTRVLKNAYNSSKWSFAQAQVGFGPSFETASTAPGYPNLHDNSHTGSLAAAVSFDVFAYLRTRKAAKITYDGSLKTLQGQVNIVEGQVDNDFFQYLQQVATVCTLKPQYVKTLNDFKILVELINSGKPYDMVSAAANIPQALGALQQLYGADILAIASISDIHAQLGDLNQPESWDISNNPQDFCPSAQSIPAEE